MDMAYKQVLSNTHRHTVVHAQACICQQSNAYFEGISLESIPCGFGSMLSIDAFECKNKTGLCLKNFLLKYFCKRLKIRKIRKI